MLYGVRLRLDGFSHVPMSPTKVDRKTSPIALGVPCTPICGRVFRAGFFRIWFFEFVDRLAYLQWYRSRPLGVTAAVLKVQS